MNLTFTRRKNPLTASPPDYAKEKIVERWRAMPPTDILNFIDMAQNLLDEGTFGLHSIENIHGITRAIHKLKNG